MPKLNRTKGDNMGYASQNIANSKVIEAMHKYGGSFVKSLAQAFDHADAANFAKLKQAFPEYWKQYEAMAEK